MLLVNGPWMLVYDAAYVVFASVTVAFLFYRFAERPARSWAARIHYGERARGPADREAGRSE